MDTIRKMTIYLNKSRSTNYITNTITITPTSQHLTKENIRKRKIEKIFKLNG